MLSQQIKSSGSLLDSVDSIRNVRAVMLLLLTFVAAALVMAAGLAMAGASGLLTMLFSLLALAVAFYGANAVGMMIMDEANGQPSRSIKDAVMTSLVTSHRLILVGLIVAAIYLVGVLALALVLFICKIPFIGPILYTVVFPLSVVISGIAMFAVPTVIFPLSAPAVWSGAGVMSCVSQLLAIARKRLLLVLLLMIAVGLIAGAVGFLIGGVLLTGTTVTAGLSASILGGGGFGGLAAMAGGMMGGMTGGYGYGYGSGGMSMGGLGTAAMIGGGVLFAAAATLPGIVYLRGACSVYLRAIDGLDLSAEQDALNEKLASAKAKAKEMQAQAQAKAKEMQAQAQAKARELQEQAQRASADKAGTGASPGVEPADEPEPPAVSAPCPGCGAATSPDDTFCGNCGYKLG